MQSQVMKKPSYGDDAYVCFYNEVAISGGFDGNDMCY